MISFLRKITTGIFTNETQTVTFAAMILAASSLVADILGLLRDRLLAMQFGAGRELDIYNAAFRIPDFLFLVLFGSISAAFIPVFAQYHEKNKQDAWRLTNNLLSIASVGIGILAVVMFIAMPALIPFVAPGFSHEERFTTVSLSRLLLLSPLVFGISSFLSGILHYFKRFLIFSFAPILYNTGIIFGVAVLAPMWGIWGVVWGVVIGACLHLAIQVPGAMLSGFRPGIVFAPLHPGIRQTVSLLIPRIPNLILTNLNIIVMTAIASSLAVGSLAVFTFADNLRSVPVGIVGISFATAAFPNLSRAWAAGRKEDFSLMVASVVREVMFLVVPVSLLFIVLRAQIIRVVLGAGRFDWEDTQLTAAAFGIFSATIFAQALIPVFMRAFFAMKDTITPLVINVFAIGVNIICALYFVAALNDPASFIADFARGVLHLRTFSDIAALALPLSFSISSLVQIVLFAIVLRVRYGSFIDGASWISMGKVVVASIIAAAVSFFALRPLSVWFGLERFAGVFAQGAIAGILGGVVYIMLAWIMNIKELKVYLSSVKRQFAPKTLPFTEDRYTSQSK